MNSNSLVSIIMPTFNASKYIGESIDSVRAQTYTNWELLIVDDGSADNTEEIVKEYVKIDNRVVYYKLENNYGSAFARSKAISLAMGRFIAFLDSDDIWFEDKLEKQISFMESNGYTFTCTSYKKIDEDGNDLGKLIRVQQKYDYVSLLKRCPGNLTVIYDASILGQFEVNSIKRRTDYVLWIQVVKKAKMLYGLNQPLAAYRVRKGSISYSKIRLIKSHWFIYRKLEGIGVTKSASLIIYIILRKLSGQ